MRERLALFVAVLFVGCSCGECGSSSRSDAGCSLGLESPDSSFGGSGGWAAQAGTSGSGAGAGGTLGDASACNDDAGIEHALGEDGGCIPVGCVSGRADCNADGTDGCETELLGSAEHCGACDNPCGDAGCSFASCRGPELFVPETASTITAFALDPSGVYLATAGNWPRIMFLSKVGSSALLTSLNEIVTQLEVHGTFLIFGWEWGVSRLDLGPGGKTSLVTTISELPTASMSLTSIPRITIAHERRHWPQRSAS